MTDSDAHLHNPHRYPHTRITFAHRGVLYIRSWDHRFTRPTAVRLARQVIRQVTKTEEYHP